MASKLVGRVEALEAGTSHDEFSHLSAEELGHRIVASLKKCEERDPDWFVKLINDPGEGAQDMVRRMAMLGFLTNEQCLLIQRLHGGKMAGPPPKRSRGVRPS